MKRVEPYTDPYLDIDYDNLHPDDVIEGESEMKSDIRFTSICIKTNPTPKTAVMTRKAAADFIREWRRAIRRGVSNDKMPTFDRYLKATIFVFGRDDECRIVLEKRK